MQGTILGSRYQVIEYIAKGGFGKTYLAEDTQLPAKDKCVVKQLFPSVDDANFIKVARRLFKTEAETLNALGIHDQIPQLMAYFEEDEKFYLVQQYIEGHTLSKELESGEPWSEEQAIKLLQDCLNILDFVHSKGVIHRDVKPDNLIRRQSDNKLVLVDFGTVKEVIAEQTQLVPSTVAVGTRGYMPTEQARGKPRTTSDIYALGVIAIQVLTGVHPMQLEENDSGEIVWQDKAQCSPELKEIIAKMTRYHFKERYQSAKDVLAALASMGQQPAAPQAPAAAVQYTPTVQLSDDELAALSPNRQGTVVNPSAVISDRSTVAPPPNATTFNSEPPASLGVSSLVAEPNEAANLNSEDNSMPQTQKSVKTLTTLGIALAVGAIATGGMYFLNQQSSKSAQNSIDEEISSFEAMISSKDYQGCYDKALAMDGLAEADSGTLPVEQQQEFKAKCGLAQAQQEADDLNYGAALDLAKTLPKGTSIDAEIKEQIDAWSAQLLADANELYEQEGDLAKAIETVRQIPQDSSIRPQVIDAKNFWKSESEANEAIITTAEKALSEEKWLYAKQQATKVKDGSESSYWQEQARAIIAQAEEGIGENSAAEVAPPKIDNNRAIAPTPQPEKVSKPAPNVVPTQPEPIISQPKPQPEPTVRVKQDSSGGLRDLGGGSESLPGIPANSPPQNDAPMRDL
ncbi:MAG: serine/threonine-protein kinase [Cyanobacteria bacterium J06623_7]